DWVQIAPGNENIFVILVGENPDKESTLIARIQQALANLGYNPGPIDGLWGGMTSSALLKFQEAESLPATGQINEATLEALGVE
ncbi:MAG: peptidoglycan-binding domain-containing protein, partial [Candidatus Sumerlaeia bacterium]|nr:peptidoglycan-binding domain-containing protein [Candidatus Sumerlaeia bacterium]